MIHGIKEYAGLYRGSQRHDPETRNLYLVGRNCTAWLLNRGLSVNYRARSARAVNTVEIPQA